MRAGELILAHFVTAYQHLLADGVAAARSWGKAITRRVQGGGATSRGCNKGSQLWRDKWNSLAVLDAYTDYARHSRH